VVVAAAVVDLVSAPAADAVAETVAEKETPLPDLEAVDAVTENTVVGDPESLAKTILRLTVEVGGCCDAADVRNLVDTATYCSVFPGIASCTNAREALGVVSAFDTIATPGNATKATLLVELVSHR
jgi:hypothetical protein